LLAVGERADDIVIIHDRRHPCRPAIAHQVGLAYLLVQAEYLQRRDLKTRKPTPPRP
jgi:hypothetical protein